MWFRLDKSAEISWFRASEAAIVYQDTEAKKDYINKAKIIKINKIY